MANAQAYYDSIPLENRGKLDKKLDFEHGNVETHLGMIADAIGEWKGSVREGLGLTFPDQCQIIADNSSSISLQKRALLRRWRQKNGFNATYRNLIVTFLNAGETDFAWAVCVVLGATNVAEGNTMAQRQNFSRATSSQSVPVYMDQYGGTLVTGHPNLAGIRQTQRHYSQPAVSAKGTRLSERLHYHKLIEFLDPYAHLWEKIGGALGFQPNALANIGYTKGHKPDVYLGHMINNWLHWAPGDGRGSENFATFEAMQDALLSVTGIEAKAYDLGAALGIPGSRRPQPSQPTDTNGAGNVPPPDREATPPGSVYKDPAPVGDQQPANRPQVQHRHVADDGIAEVEEDPEVAAFMGELARMGIGKKDSKIIIGYGFNSINVRHLKEATLTDMSKEGLTRAAQDALRTLMEQQQQPQGDGNQAARIDDPAPQDEVLLSNLPDLPPVNQSPVNQRPMNQQGVNEKQGTVEADHEHDDEKDQAVGREPEPESDGWYTKSYSPHKRSITGEDRSGTWAILVNYKPKLKLRMNSDPTLITPKPISRSQLPNAVYPMKNKEHGVALIISKMKFQLRKRRDGTRRDEENLIETFRFLGYRVERRRDCTKAQIEDLFDKIDDLVKVEDDSFVCCLLSHGSENGDENIIYGTNDKVCPGTNNGAVFLRSRKNDSLETKLKSCRKLSGKPKMFFVSACRLAQTDAAIPPDFIYCFSTQSGNESQRDPESGSHYVKTLCPVLCTKATNSSLLNMHAQVSTEVQQIAGGGYNQKPEIMTSHDGPDVYFFNDITSAFL